MSTNGEPRRKRIKMTVTLDVDVAQALALQAMFQYWNHLSKVGGSREVAFYVDGNGDFHPHCEVAFDQEVPELTDDLIKHAITRDRDGNRLYYHDGVAWKIYG